MYFLCDLMIEIISNTLDSKKEPNLIQAPFLIYAQLHLIIDNS